MKKIYLIHLLLMIIASLIFEGCSEDKRRVFPVDGFAVAGVILYEKNTPTVTSINTLRISKETAPLPYAKLEVIDATTGDIVAEGETRVDGSFIIGLPQDKEGTSLIVRTVTVSALEKFPMMVVDQDTRAYFFDSEVFTTTKNDMLVIVESPTRIEGAYNVFAQVMRSYKFMVDFGGEADTDFSALEVRWENGDVGVDCTCFMERFFQPSVINLREDENDDSVIIHEFGHYIHNTLANDSSPGGPHIISCNQNDDPRLTFSEGWATGFSLMVRRSQYYIDTGNQTFFVGHEDPCHVGQGPTSETLVAAVFFDLFDGSNILQTEDPDTINISFLQIWNAMKDIPSSFSITMHDFYLSITSSGAVSPQEWATNFNSLGFDVVTLETNSAPTIGTFSPHVNPEATSEFHRNLEQIMVR